MASHAMQPGKQVKIKYRNYKGETKEYSIEPIELFYGRTTYYTEEQWMILAVKTMPNGEKLEREFSMKNIIAWR